MTFEQDTLDEFNRRVSADKMNSAVTILKKWGCKDPVGCKILAAENGLYSQATFGMLYSEEIDNNQLTRIDIILNIHFSLKRIFDNPQNVSGFMSMKNNNDFFQGKSPISVIEDGDIDALIETAKRIEALIIR